MSAGGIVQAGPTSAQRRAADPSRSVWVTANAGTGKTRVLADRVLRLLLEGAEPESILCITFTKAAATEMVARIERRLAAWATASDEEDLAREIEDLTGATPDPQRVATARRLFTRVLDLPRGLGVMTIHAFCGTLLRRFPLEAEVAPHFETIDERTAAELMAEAREAVLAAARDATTPLGRAVEILTVTLAETTLVEALSEIMGQRVRLLRTVERHGGIAGLLDSIDDALGAPRGVTPHQLVERACADGVYDARALVDAANDLVRGSATDQDRGRRVLAWLNAAPDDRVRLFETHCRCFLKADGDGLARLATKQVPEIAVRALVAEQARLLAVRDDLKRLQIALRTRALLIAGLAVVEAYEARKRREAALDYNDLIERTRRLLAAPGQAQWVLYKLDQRIDHVLVDEAQDTSPEQWEIVERLTAEFFAGKGSAQRPRTVFVVGDEKQSIYSFQGADLGNLRRVRARLEGAAQGAGAPLHAEALEISFRSVPAVLRLVDGVLAEPEAQAGVVEGSAVLRHETSRVDEAGLVELWPLAQPAEAEADPEPWALPDLPRPSDDPAKRVATAIAQTVQGWLQAREILESAGRPIRAGDVLILLSRRGAMQELLIRTLKRTGVPVAGADRLALTDHIAVKDLMALGRALLLPEDDLTFACLLKSPLVGLDEEALFELAWNRGASSLIERLRAGAAARPERFGVAYERIRGWLQRADFMPPFELFCRVLGEERGRERLLARLGPDAAEPIEAFLGQALAYEQGHPSSLEGFMHWLDLGDQQLKRDPEQAADAVRVVTVHGAKGLEAPIVILADAGPQGRPPSGRLLWHQGLELPFWRAPKAERDPLTEEAARNEADRLAEERSRLLYVALTRARDRLYVAGWQSKREGKDACWHQIVGRSMAGLSGVVTEERALGPELSGEVLSLRSGTPADLLAGSDVQQEAEGALPSWALQPAGPETVPPRPLAPSRLGDEPPVASPVGPDAARRARVGILVHKLLELLPEAAASERSALAEAWLARTAPELSAVERDALVRQVLQVIERPDLASIFGPGSLAEQSIAGLVGGVAISGQIDRLAVGPDTVIAVDFKSGRGAPARPEAIPRLYVRQMAAYRALLTALYPDRAIRCGLVWTASGEVTWLPDELIGRDALRMEDTALRGRASGDAP